MVSQIVLDRLAGHIQKRKEEDTRLYHLFLTRCLLQNSVGEGYRALARLIRGGYFSKILTSNTDTALEVALEEQGVRSSQYEVFAVGQDSDERIAATLDGQKSGIHIVKLYGNRSQSEQTSSLFKLSSDVQTSLQHYFNRNIIIVGCMDQEEDGIYALQSHKEESIYYVLQDNPPFNDIVVKCLHKQDRQPSHFLVTGPYGEFNTFFSTLETCIKQRVGRNQALPTGSKLVSHKDFRDELLHVNPEAIGGEMEGAGLSEVGNRKHVEWVLVKAICDWADADKNDAHQMLAAKNAARFVIQVVSQEQFVHLR